MQLLEQKFHFGTAKGAADTALRILFFRSDSITLNVDAADEVIDG
jgi:hypothetical protein